MELGTVNGTGTETVTVTGSAVRVFRGAVTGRPGGVEVFEVSRGVRQIAASQPKQLCLALLFLFFPRFVFCLCE